MNKLAYFISKGSMISIGFLILIKDNGKNSYIALTLGAFLGIIIIYLYSLLKKKNINNKIFRFIIILLCMLLLCINLTVLTLFVNSFYLVNTPRLFILIPFVLLAVYLTTKEKRVLFDLSNLFYFISISLVTIFGLFLCKYVNIKNIYPIFNYNNLSIIKGAISYAALSSIPLILVMDYYRNTKMVIKDYLVGSTINSLILTFIILTSGDTLMRLYTFPEYATLKQIKIFDFIENIENLSAFGWYLEIFVIISLLITKLKDNLPLKFKYIYITIIIMISLFISEYLISSRYDLLMNIYDIYPYILLSFLLLFVIILFTHKKNNT